MSADAIQPDIAAKLCPKCGGSMVQGFVADQGDGMHKNHLASWFRGTPERSFWTGIRLSDKYPIPIATFRCSDCGFLEAYADQQFDAK